MNLRTIRERTLQTSLVRDLPAAMRLRFAMLLFGIGETRELAPSEALFVQGDRTEDEGILLAEGAVRVVIDGNPVKQISAPEIMGELQLFTAEGTRTATVEAASEALVLSFRWRDLGETARSVFSEDEMQALKRTLTDIAWEREKGIAQVFKPDEDAD